jgi:multicomponent Na+:H+ antiporter subunit E
MPPQRVSSFAVTETCPGKGGGYSGNGCCQMIKNRIVLFVLGILLWLLLSWSLNWEEMLLAVFAGILVAWLTADVFPRKVRIFTNPVRYLWILYYIPMFIWECIKANIDGAYRSAHPDILIKPGIVKVRTTLRSDTGLTLLANTLTLKPGTMTVDIDRENGFLYVHWSDVTTQDVNEATKKLVLRFEKILKRIFD